MSSLQPQAGTELLPLRANWHMEIVLLERSNPSGPPCVVRSRKLTGNQEHHHLPSWDQQYRQHCVSWDSLLLIHLHLIK